MDGPTPDPRRFAAVVGGAIERSLAAAGAVNGDGTAVVRAYGEMVDVLWKEDNTDGALRLEELWNELASTHAFSLLCAYAMGNFYRTSDAERFRDVCRHHTHVIPTEHYTGSDEPTRLVEISLLQQRARALESEIEHREELEHRLREMLTARQRAEEALRRSEQELKELLENASEGIHWVGPDGVILWANRAELALLGYSRDEYVGHHIAEFHEDRAAIADMLECLARDETLVNREARLRGRDGSVRDVLVNSNVLRRGGEFIHTCCFTRDISQMKRAADERERLLERERAARAEAEAANRAKTDFLAVMSHELRTPLNAIGGYAELLAMGIRGPVTQAQGEDLERIQASQRHLLGLINDVLNYAKLESGSVRYDIRDVMVRDEIAATERLVAPQARSKGLALSVADCPLDLAVRADPDKLRQIVVNLLSNAIKFTDHGGIDVRCEARGAGTVLVHVRDSGVGIPASKLEAIFEPFVQVHAGFTRPADGTGLGLAISRDLARAMGGDLTVESRVGVGSTFTLRLPRGPAAAPA
jgi:PAS domain S-box-containing protein